MKNKSRSNCLLASAIFCVAFLAMATTSNAAEKNCQLKLLGEIKLLGDGNAYMPVILGSKPALMALHTSALASMVYEPAVELFGLSRKPTTDLMPAVKIGDVYLREFAKFNDLHIENLRFTKGMFMVNPTVSKLAYIDGVPIVGTLGMDVFGAVDFELDLGHRKLKLFSHDHCPGKVVYWTGSYVSTPMFRGKGGNIYFPVELDGEKIEATFDPGAESSTLHTDVTKKLYDWDESAIGTEKVLNPIGGVSYYYRAMQITSPGLTISNAKIQLLSPNEGCRVKRKNPISKAAGYDECYGPFPLNLGRTVLNRLRIYFATKEKMVYFSDADASK